MTHTVRLPKGWAETTLAELGRWSSGGTPSRSMPEYFGGPIPWVKTGDLGDGLITSTPESITESGLTSSSAKLFPPGTLLIAMYGATIGKLALLGVEASTNQACAALLPDTSIRESIPYIFYYLMSVRRDLRNAGKGGAQPNISQTVLKVFPIPIAPPQEQRRIVEAIESYLTRLDDAAASLERVQRNLERYRASVLKAAVEGRLVPTEAQLARLEGRSYEPASELLERILAERKTRWIEDAVEKARAKANGNTDTLPKARKKAEKKYKDPVPPDLSALQTQAGTTDLPTLPDGWCWASVEQLVVVGTGATPKRGDVRYWEDGNISWVGSAVVNRPYVRDATELVTETALRETNLTIYPPGTLLVAMYGEGKTRGKYAELIIESTTNQALAALVFSASSDPLRPFIKLFMEHNYTSIRRTASGGVQPNLNLGIIKKIAIPVPPLAEQARICITAESLLTVGTEVERAVLVGTRRGERLRQSILKWAFEGKLVEQDPDDEPASELLERIRSERDLRRR